MKTRVSSVHEKNYTDVCKLCLKAFSSIYNLRGHIASVHEGIKPFMCEICSKKFDCNTSMKRHIKFIHGERNKLETFKCNICDNPFPFLRKENLKIHMQKHHQEKK